MRSTTGARIRIRLMVDTKPTMPCINNSINNRLSQLPLARLHLALQANNLHLRLHQAGLRPVGLHRPPMVATIVWAYLDPPSHYWKYSTYSRYLRFLRLPVYKIRDKINHCSLGTCFRIVGTAELSYLIWLLKCYYPISGVIKLLFRAFLALLSSLPHTCKHEGSFGKELTNPRKWQNYRAPL